MATTGGKKVYKGDERELRLSEWMDRLSIKSVDLAKELGISESYVSDLRSGRLKKQPGVQLLLRISDFMEITVNDLYTRPPPRDAIRGTERLKPADIAALARINEAMKGSGRK